MRMHLVRVAVAFLIVGIWIQASAGEPAAETPQTPAPSSPSPGSEAADAPAAQPGLGKLSPGVLARVNGRDIRVEEYGSYLLARFGQSLLDEYIDRLLLDEEARRLGVEVSADRVESEVEERQKRKVKSAFQGSEEAYAEWLARRRTTPEAERARLRQDIYYDMLGSEVYHRVHPVTEDQVREEFGRVYGDGGVELVLRHILVSTRELPRGSAPPGESPGTPAPPFRRSPREARVRAEEARKEILGGLDFGKAVEKYSDDTYTRRNEGRIPRYTKGLFGDRFHEAAMGLSPEKPLSDVVESPRGYHVIRLEERRVTRFDDVKEEIETYLKNAPLGPERCQELIRELRERARIETP